MPKPPDEPGDLAERRRLRDLIGNPKEQLDVELKGWLDLGTPDGKADLAQALLALANHGGGWVLIGFDDAGKPDARVPSDPGPIHAAASRCRREQRLPDGTELWGYSLEGLRFFLGAQRKTRPQGVGSVECALSVKVIGEWPLPVEHDPFRELSVDYILTAESAGGQRQTAAWHLDRHIGTEPSKDAHPLYHLQHGGRHLRDAAIDVGHTLVLEAPRIAHPPMEAILAVDFMLANFAGVLWRRLREDGAYLRVVHESMQRLWKPHYDEIAGRGPHAARLFPFWDHR